MERSIEVGGSVPGSGEGSAFWARERWPAGPWDEEPLDHVCWVDSATGLRCFLERCEYTYGWIGGVELHSLHPLWGLEDTTDSPLLRGVLHRISQAPDIRCPLAVSVRQAAGKELLPRIPHVLRAHRGVTKYKGRHSTGVTFDCSAHPLDLVPLARTGALSPHAVYRTFDYCVGQVRDLARQVKEVELDNVRDLSIPGAVTARFRAREPRRLRASVAGDGLLVVEDLQIGLSAWGYCHEELWQDVRATLHFLWDQYALAEDDRLTVDARELKQALLRTFVAVEGAK